VKSWFGYGLHLIADTHYEIPVVFHLTPASHSEQVELRTMTDELFEQTSKLAERCAVLVRIGAWMAPKPRLSCGMSITSVHLSTPANCGVQKNRRPIMTLANRLRVLSTPDRADTIVYTEKGTVHCVCLVTGTQRDSFCFEKHFIRGQAKMKTRMGLAPTLMNFFDIRHLKSSNAALLCRPKKYFETKYPPPFRQ
jgi:hypothetical protein